MHPKSFDENRWICNILSKGSEPLYHMPELMDSADVYLTKPGGLSMKL